MSDLYHFGVKGMKWGIRKDRQSKDYGEGDRIIKKGTKFQTVSMNELNLDSRLYAAYTPKDKALYASAYAKVLRSSTVKGTLMKNEYTNKIDIRVAGKKTQEQAFVNLFNKDPKGVIESIAYSQEHVAGVLLIGRSYQPSDSVVKSQAAKFAKAYDKKSARGKGEEWVRSHSEIFSMSAGAARNPTDTQKAYYKEVARMGFDAMTDRTDHRTYSTDPIVFLEPRKSISKQKSMPLTKADIKLAGMAYKKEKKAARVDDQVIRN